ncbi:MAG: HEAT repeat domain-containing protein [Spirochaetes bacterium]|nr:MAG: HEAT repeat domain-containing protein [Spirochaetota bacterium]
MKSYSAIFSLSKSVLLVVCALIACTKITTIQRTDRAAIQSSLRLFQETNWQARQKALNELASFTLPIDDPDFPAIENAYLLALDDSHQIIRIEALKNISSVTSVRILNRAAEIAEGDPNLNIRWYALKSLSGFRKPAFLNVFIKGLSSDDWLIREESIRGLLTIDDQALVRQQIPLVLHSLEDPNYAVRLAALENLTIRDSRLYNSIAGMLNSEMREQHSILAALLKAIRGYQLDQETRRHVSEFLLHSNSEIRVLALRALKASDEAETAVKKS